jgi:hypothetical protein
LHGNKSGEVLQHFKFLVPENQPLHLNFTLNQLAEIDTLPILKEWICTTTFYLCSAPMPDDDIKQTLLNLSF